MLARLFRARLTALVLLTTVVGFYLGAAAPLDWMRLLETLVGTALVAAAASALNQWWERELDARMPRTQERPLPTGRLRPTTVLVGGLVSAALGLLVLALVINGLTSALGFISLAVYVLIYTPLKRRTWMNTMVGTISGAIPALMGWTAARGRLSLEGWAFFAILVLWQLPHFLAIAWIYRDQYARAGFRMLSAGDPDGRRSGRQAVGFTVGLWLASIAPYALGVAGPVYGCGTLLLGLGFLVCALRFWREATLPRARQLFRASIWYMTLLLLLLVVDKIN